MENEKEFKKEELKGHIVARVVLTYYDGGDTHVKFEKGKDEVGALMNMATDFVSHVNEGFTRYMKKIREAKKQ